MRAATRVLAAIVLISAVTGLLLSIFALATLPIAGPAAFLSYDALMFPVARMLAFVTVSAGIVLAMLMVAR